MLEFEAVFENGVLRPLQPLLLSEHERVKLTVARTEGNDFLDQEFMDACRADADPTITLNEVRAALAKIAGSMDDAIQEDRGQF